MNEELNKEEMKEEKTKDNSEKVKQKEVKIEKVKKEKAIAKATSLRISTKNASAICKVIKGKDPQKAIERLEMVIKEKRAIPMESREVAHQKGKGLSGASYPRNASKEIIKVIKQLRANSVINGIENPVITIAKADKASAPFRRGGRKTKRTHIYLEAKEKSKLLKEKK